MRTHLGWLTLLAMVLCGLVGLMFLPTFNPGHFRGGWFGMGIIVLWGWALFLWAVGKIRKNGSRLRASTCFLAVVALALMFGACPWLPVPYSIQLGFTAISAAMIHEAWHDVGQPNRLRLEFRGRLSRTVLTSAGLLGLAVVIHGWLQWMGWA
jgi:hypothetical protein